MPIALLALLSLGLGLSCRQASRYIDSMPSLAGEAQGDGASLPDLLRHAALLDVAPGSLVVCALALSLHARLRCGGRAQGGEHL